MHVQKSLRLFSFTLLAFFRFSVFSCSPCFFPFFFFSLFSSFPFCSFPLFPLFRFFPCSSFFPLFCFPFPSFRSFFSALPTFPALLFAYIRLFYRCSKNGRKMPDKGQRHFLWICVPFAHIMRTPKILCFFVPKYRRPLFYGEKRLKTGEWSENQPAERFRYYGGRRVFRSVIFICYRGCRPNIPSIQLQAVSKARAFVDI